MKEILDILNGMSPYLLLGFLIAGIMRAFVPGKVFSRYLAENNFRSVVNAALIGIPVPLCSCGVIPAAMSMRKEGASKGAAVSFLIATPQTGVDSVLATYGLMGWPMALLRPVAALAVALFGGALVNRLGTGEGARPLPASRSGSADDKCGCTHDGEGGLGMSWSAKLKFALKYGFVDMISDIGKWLVVGLVAAALITVAVPESFFEMFAGNTVAGMLLVLAFAVPMYLCATGSIPIAVALMLKGLTPGAALVMLMAGPACNVASILVLGKVLGRKVMLTYLAAIIAGTVAFGFGVDYLLPRDWFEGALVSGHCGDAHQYGVFSVACTVVFVGLLLYAMISKLRIRRGHGAESKPESCCGHCRDSV